MGVTTPSPVVYRSLQQVWKTLTQNNKAPEVRCVINLCMQKGLFRRNENEAPELAVSPTSVNRENAGFPFIVIEGLDGTGKTTLTRYLSSRLNMKLMSTPPKNDMFMQVRKFFDEQPETLRRAYYSLGNYIAAHDVMLSSRPVVMDRFWHSTAAYALAHQVKRGELNLVESTDLTWPGDLLQPDLVIFLQVTEEERLRRHAMRRNFTNTPEEKTLAADFSFRKNIVQYYRAVFGPHYIELTVNGEQPDSEAQILKTVLHSFPFFEEKLKTRMRAK